MLFRSGRWLLSAERAGMQLRKYAEGLFLRREVFRTAERCGVLIVIAAFEQRATIVMDTGVARHFTRDDIEAITNTMAPPVRAGTFAEAFRTGFDGVAQHLKNKGVAFRTQGNELPDGTIVENGA